MRTYKVDFEQIRQDPKMANLIQALERGFEKFGIGFYLVGAVSRDLWMSGIHGIKPRRTTGDIDFAVCINDKGVYEALKDYLITQEGFSSYKENAFVLIDKDGMEVDLLPFGAIEEGDGRVVVQGTGYTSIHVDGFKEVYDDHLPEVELGSNTFKFCSLPGLVLLKMIAWEDRPESRTSDITDISDILNHYFDMHADTIYDEHADIFTDESAAEASLPELAARVMGREIRHIVQRSEKLLTRITNLLQTQTEDVATSRMAEIMVQYFKNSVEGNLRLLQHLKKGFDEQPQG
jgi:predicted nucleotidyltransferase